jgi:hypothetical protein
MISSSQGLPFPFVPVVFAQIHECSYWRLSIDTILHSPKSSPVTICHTFSPTVEAVEAIETTVCHGQAAIVFKKPKQSSTRKVKMRDCDSEKTSKNAHWVIIPHAGRASRPALESRK